MYRAAILIAGCMAFEGPPIEWAATHICHTFGKRSFEAQDESRNEWIVGS